MDQNIRKTFNLILKKLHWSLEGRGTRGGPRQTEQSEAPLAKTTEILFWLIRHLNKINYFRAGRFS